MKKKKSRSRTKVEIDADMLHRMHAAVENFLDDWNELPSWPEFADIYTMSKSSLLRFMPLLASPVWQAAVASAKRLKTQGTDPKQA